MTGKMMKNLLLVAALVGGVFISTSAVAERTDRLKTGAALLLNTETEGSNTLLRSAVVGTSDSDLELNYLPTDERYTEIANLIQDSFQKKNPLLLVVNHQYIIQCGTNSTKVKKLVCGKIVGASYGFVNPPETEEKKNYNFDALDPNHIVEFFIEVKFFVKSIDNSEVKLSADSEVVGFKLPQSGPDAEAINKALRLAKKLNQHVAVGLDDDGNPVFVSGMGN